MTNMPMRTRAVRFLLVGGLCAAITYLGYEAGLRLGVNYLLANAAGWLAGVVVGFVLNRRLTFGVSGGGHVAAQSVQYVLGQALQLAGTTITLGVLVSGLHLGPRVAFVLNTGFWAIWSFAWMHFVFRRRSAPAPARAA
jgi:putative flippase GtrA